MDWAQMCILRLSYSTVGSVYNDNISTFTYTQSQSSKQLVLWRLGKRVVDNSCLTLSIYCSRSRAFLKSYSVASMLVPEMYNWNQTITPICYFLNWKISKQCKLWYQNIYSCCSLLFKIILLKHWDVMTMLNQHVDSMVSKKSIRQAQEINTDHVCQW